MCTCPPAVQVGGDTVDRAANCSDPLAHVSPAVRDTMLKRDAAAPQRRPNTRCEPRPFLPAQGVDGGRRLTPLPSPGTAMLAPRHLYVTPYSVWTACHPAHHEADARPPGSAKTSTRTQLTRSHRLRRLLPASHDPCTTPAHAVRGRARAARRHRATETRTLMRIPQRRDRARGSHASARHYAAEGFADERSLLRPQASQRAHPRDRTREVTHAATTSVCLTSQHHFEVRM